MNYTISKGVFDILPEQKNPHDQWKTSHKWQYLESVIRITAQEYGFSEIRTPIFEKTELFLRGVGESSDIVTKEMYTFTDKGGRSLTLRPEGTASAMRAFVDNQLAQQGHVHKLFYIGPMFRYERPQSGRYRQHHQFGAEAIGISKPEQDAEVIDLLCEIYRRLGLRDLTVMINSVGDAQSRGPYLEALKQYLEPHFAELSEDSKARFSKNILRILDSKDPGDQKILEGAPSIHELLAKENQEHFQKLQTILKTIDIPFVVNPKLVRGLDYYNKTVFEIVCGSLGAQNTIGGGGRYDGLISTLGGPDLPAIGFGTGLERILQTMDKQQIQFPSPSHPLIYLIPLGDEASSYCFALATKLRRMGTSVDVELSGKKVQAGLQRASSLHAPYAIIIGENEISTQKVSIKNMQTRESSECALSAILETIIQLRAQHV